MWETGEWETSKGEICKWGTGKWETHGGRWASGRLASGKLVSGTMLRVVLRSGRFFYSLNFFLALPHFPLLLLLLLHPPLL